MTEQGIISIMIACTAGASRLYDGYDIRGRVYYGPTSINIQFAPLTGNIDLGYQIMAQKLSFAVSAVAMSTMSSHLLRFLVFWRLQ